MRRPSLRLLLMVSVLAAITVGFAAFATFIDHVERHNRLTDIDEELQRAGQSGFQRRDIGLDRAQESDFFEESVGPPVQLLLTSEAVVIASAGSENPFSKQTLQTLVTSEGTRSIAGPGYRVQTVMFGENIALTALPLDDFQTAASRFRLALSTGGATILALVAVVLWLVTGYITRPVTQLADMATRIADGELETRVDAPSGSRESAELAVDLDRMLSRLRTALDEAVEARDTTERFLADMAHEIRTPLTGLKGYSDLYAQGMLEDTTDVDRAMSRIGSESERLYHLANGMLQLASVRYSGDTAEEFDVAEIVGEVADDLRAAHPNQLIELKFDADADHMVPGVRSKIHQAILNLGSNACHYNIAPRPILITATISDDSCTITVIDHGPGIDADHIDKVFLPFYRSDTARSRNGTVGAGLGLALTKQIADHHMGHVDARNTPGGGATFTLKIPRSYSEDIGPTT